MNDNRWPDGWTESIDLNREIWIVRDGDRSLSDRSLSSYLSRWAQLNDRRVRNGSLIDWLTFVHVITEWEVYPTWVHLSYITPSALSNVYVLGQLSPMHSWINTHTHAHTHIHTYIYICVCVCVCIYIGQCCGPCHGSFWSPRFCWLWVTSPAVRWR